MEIFNEPEKELEAVPYDNTCKVEVRFPAAWTPLVTLREPEKELDPVLTEVKVPEMEALPPKETVPLVSRSPEIKRSLVVEM